MGFKEGWEKGEKVVEIIYRASEEFGSVSDPRLDARLRQVGVTQADINRLMLRFTLDPEEWGYMASGVAFVLKHGTIWNSDDMHGPKFEG